MKNMDDFHCERKPSCATTKSTLFFSISAKINGTQRASPLMHCVYCGMPKGTSQTLNSEKIKPVALAVGNSVK